MSDETTLLPCPFCGGEASRRLFYGARYGVYCDECDARVGGLLNTEAEAIAAWNARAERGTLTAEQVSKATYAHSIHADCADADWQAIADELNARAERTCECVSEYAKSPLDGKTIVLHRCSECHELMRPHLRYCPNCGCKVVDA